MKNSFMKDNTKRPMNKTYKCGLSSGGLAASSPVSSLQNNCVTLFLFRALLGVFELKNSCVIQNHVNCRDRGCVAKSETFTHNLFIFKLL